VARFYGFSHSDINNMSYEDFIVYSKGICILSSEEYLMNIRVGTFPNMKVETQKKFESDLRRGMKENLELKLNTKSPQEIAMDFARKLRNG